MSIKQIIQIIKIIRIYSKTSLSFFLLYFWLRDICNFYRTLKITKKIFKKSFTFFVIYPVIWITYRLPVWVNYLFQIRFYIVGGWLNSFCNKQLISKVQKKKKLFYNYWGMIIPFWKWCQETKHKTGIHISR